MNHERTNPANFERVRTVFHEALAREVSERSAFLRNTCGPDQSLLSEVERLLDHHNTGDSFLTPLCPVRESDAQIDRDWAGRRLGAFRLLRPIGAGGMGAVWLAERVDGAFEQRVAVKLLHQSLLGSTSKERFDSERNTLAQLEHPYIARIIDGGTTPDGIPFFVMEHVEGVRIDDYCHRHSLSITKRVQLFRRVCEPVQYAHQRLIIHCDLKPSNILVTSDGSPRIIDFGIARLVQLADDDQFHPSVLSSTPSALTPTYASPEQLRGERMTTASDVYSLGVVLHELLTGSLPRWHGGTQADELLPQVSRDDTTKPNSIEEGVDRTNGAATPKNSSDSPRILRRQETNGTQKARRLCGDLDAILLHATHRDSNHRYCSIEHFAGDLDRYLDQMPILIRSDKTSYRVSKFVRRHRSMVVSLLVILGTLIAGLVGSLRHGRAMAHARNDAMLALAYLAEGRVDTIISGSLRLADDVDLEDKRDVAAMYRKLAGLCWIRGHYQAAALASGEALDLLGDVADPSEPEMLDAIELHALTLKDIGSYDEAETHLRQVLAERRRLYPEVPEEIGSALNNLAVVLRKREEFHEAERVYQEAIAVFRSDPNIGDCCYSHSLVGLARVYLRTDVPERAEPLLREAQSVRREQFPEGNFATALVDGLLGHCLDLQGRSVDAEPLLASATETLDQHLGPEHKFSVEIRSYWTSWQEENND